MTIKIFQVDAFTEKPFGGNPAAVCILKGAAEEGWMQLVAMEMNLSETAFLYPVENGYNLRWFTPAIEVPLCGHATLASAHILWETGLLGLDQSAEFNSASGKLTAKKIGKDIQLNFPAITPQPSDIPTGLLEALGIDQAVYIGRTKDDYLIEVTDEQIVRALDPDFSALKKLSLRGVMVTAKGNSRFDFVSRFFAPGAGIDEDPVTGSAHCVLGVYWEEKLGKEDLLAYQASARGGELGVIVKEDRVYLRGRAITVLRGELVGMD